MKRMIRCAALGLAACLLTTMAAGAKNRVTRPFKIWSDDNVMIVDPATGLDVAYRSTGHATHFGLFSSEGTSPGVGFFTTANGEQVWWHFTEEPDGLHFALSFTRGTGRFEGVSGGFSGVLEDVQLVDATPEGFLVFTFTYAAAGTITY